MATDETARVNLTNKLVEVLGPEEAATLMERLHPQDWSKLATKDDLNQWRTEFRAELRGEVAGVEGGLAELRGEMRHMTERVDFKLDALEARLSAQISDFRSEFHLALRDQFSRTVMLLVPSMFSAVGIAFAAAKFS